MAESITFLNFSACCDNFSYDGFSTILYTNTQSLVTGQTYYFSNISSCSTPTCLPTNLSGCFTFTSTANTPTYNYYSSVTIPISATTCEDCLITNPCPTEKIFVVFEKCCKSGNLSEDIFQMEIDLIDTYVVEQAIYIESEFFNGCATIKPIFEAKIPPQSLVYQPSYYSFTGFSSELKINGCDFCTATTIGCSTKPAPTPTIYYTAETYCGDFILKKNECEPIVIFPMGVECVAVNPTRTNRPDGRLSFLITGGTPPYIVTWENGVVSLALDNLGAGEYTATITDSYGDFTISQTCVLEYETPIVPPEPTPTPIPTQTFCMDVVYVEDGITKSVQLFFEKTGSFINGRPEYSDGINNDIGWVYGPPSYWSLENPPGGFDIYTTTLDDPPLTGWTSESPTTQIIVTESICRRDQILCLSIKQGEVVDNNVNMFYNGVVNGRPSWSSATPSFFISWSALDNLWILNTPNTYSFPVVNYNPDIPPIAGWQQLGVPVGSNITVLNHLCVNQSVPVSFIVTQNNPTNGDNGNIALRASGGYPPYQYSITNGVTYQNLPIFTNLSSGSYTTKVLDSSGFTASQTIILT